MQSKPQQTVDKQMPAIDILYLVKEKIFYICAVYYIQRLQYIIKVIYREFVEPVIIKIHIAIFHTFISKRHVA